MQGHICSRNDSLFQRSHGGYKWFDRHQKCTGEVSLHFQSQLNTLVFSSVLTDKNLKDRGQENVGAVPRKRTVCGRTLYDLFSPVFGVIDY